MAVEDNSDPASSQPIPDYRQMIMEAIETLDEEEGSSPLAISNYLETNYPDLTLTVYPAHSTLLSTTLESLKQTGELLFCDGNYIKPEEDDEAPAVKRGRGRPPKAKFSSATESGAGPARSRGRPPKPRDPLAPPPEPKKISVRPRGRPRKYPKEDDAPGAEVKATVEAVSGVKRGRGRPPKVKA